MIFLGIWCLFYGLSSNQFKRKFHCTPYLFMAWFISEISPLGFALRILSKDVSLPQLLLRPIWPFMSFGVSFMELGAQLWCINISNHYNFSLFKIYSGILYLFWLVLAFSWSDMKIVIAPWSICYISRFSFLDPQFLCIFAVGCASWRQYIFESRFCLLCFVSIQVGSPCVFIGETRLFAFMVVVKGSLLSLYGFLAVVLVNWIHGDSFLLLWAIGNLWLAVLDAINSFSSLFIHCSHETVFPVLCEWVFLSSVYSVSCHPCLITMHCALIFCLPWSALICLFILKDNVAGYASLDSQLFSFRALDTSVHTFLAFRSVDERPNITWMFVPLYVSWHFIS